MEVINATIFIVFFFSLMAVMSKQKENKPNIIFVVIIIIILGLVSGLRTAMGDTVYYVHSYKLIGEELDSNIDENISENKTTDETYEKGWVDLNKFLNSISRDPQFMLLVTSFIIVTFTILTLRKYASLFELQTFLYITCGTYMVSMNGIRQCVAASILFWAVRFIVKGKFIPYCIVVLFLMNLHESAFIMIPIYFIVRLEAWHKKTIKILGIGFVFVMIYGKLAPLLSAVMQDSGYSGYLQNPEEGANILRVVIAAVPVILSYAYKDDLKDNWNECDAFINMSIINLIFMSLATYNWIFARFTLYFELYNVVLLPYIIKSIPNIKEKRIIYYTAVVCYALYFILESRTSDYYTPYISIHNIFL